uniref:C2H2-type domain-containing protein n=1 Tax=Macrostomum lignano TaxID=282301 RepID=A0A1I8GPR3_9PLAT
AAFVRSDHLRSHVRTHSAKRKRSDSNSDSRRTIEAMDGEQEDELEVGVAVEAAKMTKRRRCHRNDEEVEYEKDSSSSASQQHSDIKHHSSSASNSASKCCAETQLSHQEVDLLENQNQSPTNSSRLSADSNALATDTN